MDRGRLNEYLLALEHPSEVADWLRVSPPQYNWKVDVPLRDQDLDPAPMMQLYLLGYLASFWVALVMMIGVGLGKALALDAVLQQLVLWLTFALAVGSTAAAAVALYLRDEYSPESIEARP